mgnify:CR=1 FL=1
MNPSPSGTSSEGAFFTPNFAVAAASSSALTIAYFTPALSSIILLVLQLGQPLLVNSIGPLTAAAAGVLAAQSACSACDFFCLCVDAYYFELYMKDEEEIREVLHQLGSLSGAQVVLKTDETDSRYRMTID